MYIRASWLAVVAVLCVAPPCLSQPNYFWNGTSGAYSDTSKWSFNGNPPASPPGAGDRALFLGGSGFTVTGNGSPAQVVVQSATATFTGVISPQGNVTGFLTLITGFDVGQTGPGEATFQGSGASLNSARPITVGGSSSGDGILNFRLGATGFATGLSNAAAVGISAAPSAIGAMTIDGAGSAFTSTGTFDLGGRNSGTVTVTNNGTLNTNGILAFNQAGLNIGGAISGAINAQGTLNISNGGTVHNELQTNIGLYGKGTVNISSGTFTSTDGGTPNPAISIARFFGSEGHLNVSGDGHVITEGELIVGGGGNGYMTITDAGLVESHVTVGIPAIVGFGSNSNGLVTINGIDAQWTVTDALIVGQLSTGQIDLVDGGTLFLENTFSEDVPYIYIGDAAGSDGTITVADEFSFLDASNIFISIGHDQFSNGKLEVTDQGRAYLQFTVIGDGGTGDVYAGSGGRLQTGIVVLGAQSTGVGTATIDTGATWEVGGDVYVGGEGNGELYVENNSTLTVNGLISVGESEGSTGLLSINGANAVVNGTYVSVTIGFLGHAELSLSTGATWAVNTDVTIAEIEGSEGIATIDATSHWNIASGLYVGGSAVATGGVGELNVAGQVTAATTAKIWGDSTATLINGGKITTPTLTIEGTLAGNGTIEGAGTNDGLIAPSRTGATTGRITFTGNYTQTAESLLEIQLGGTIPLTEHDQIVVGGVASLDGQLHVSLTDVGLGLFSPVLGDQFIILTAASFDPAHPQYAPENITLPELIEGYDWDVFYTATELVLRVIETGVLPGDYNENGIVDAADYVVWRKYAGTNHELPNDPIGNMIGPGQFDQWRQHFGQAAAGSGTALNAPIPEPAAMVLFASALFITAANCRSRRPIQKTQQL